ncbi:MAG TPA: hypothetical protein VF940_07090 [Streptosporangiaceae bacterium]
MAAKFNPPPGWPLPYGFEPPPGWEPDPTWPPPPPNWPLWMGKDAPRSGYQADPLGSYSPRNAGEYTAAQKAHTQGLRPAPDYGYRQQQTGASRRLSRASLLKRLGGFLIVLLAAIIVIASINRSAGSGPSTSHTHGNGQVIFFTLRTGACFQNPAHEALLHGRTAEVTVVPCTTAHSAQIFAQFRATGGATYPGRRALERQGGHDCRSVLAARVRRSKVKPKTLLWDLYPDTTSWFTGRRTISCLVIDPARDLTTSVLKRRATG